MGGVKMYLFSTLLGSSPLSPPLLEDATETSRHWRGPNRSRSFRRRRKNDFIVVGQNPFRIISKTRTQPLSSLFKSAIETVQKT